MEKALNISGQGAVANSAPRGSNQSGMRAYNERLVLSLIRQAGAMAKAEIARQTGLSAQTVSVIMRALEADGLLRRGEPIRGKIGQPSVPMSLANDGAFFFGLKIGRRSLDLVLTDFLGTVQDRVRVSHPYPTPDDAVHFAAEMTARMLDRLPIERRTRVSGLGIALPFQLWDWSETYEAPPEDLQGWRTRDIAAEIGALCDFPVYLCNDASAACGAELVFGDQGKAPNFLYFFVGSFVGGGLVLDGTLYTGETGNAAALGSMLVPSADGRMRQLVDVASLASLENAVRSAGHADRMKWDTPDSWNLPSGPLDTWTRTAARAIAHAALSSVCLIDVHQVYIDGWMPAEMRGDLVRRVGQSVADLSVAGVQPPSISAGTVGRDARALGAASLPLSERFLVERNIYQKGPVK